MTKPFNAPQPQDNKDRMRLIVAVTLSLAVLFGFNHFVEKPRQEKMKAQLEAQAIAEQQTLDIKAREAGAAVGGSDKVVQTREEALTSAGTRLPIKGLRVSGSLSLTGLRIDDLTLNEHTEVLNGSEPVVLLAPGNTDMGYYFESGWVANGYAGALPNAKTTWRVAADSPKEITSGGAPVVLEWDNGAGLTFIRDIALDDNYMFTVTNRVKNNSGSDVRLNAYHVVARNSQPRDFSGFFVLHEGPIGSLDGEQEKLSYKKMRDDKKIERNGVSGWLGITDKYWLVAMIPSKDEKFNARVVGAPRQNAAGYVYQTDIVSNPVTIAAGATADDVTHIYAGVKNTGLMADYESSLGVKNLDFAVDFGMWYFITQPFYYLLHLLFSLTGSVAAGILLMTVIIRAAVFPLASKGFRSMARMKLIAPQLKELQDKHKNDKAALQMAIFDLYKREQVNPFSGCWPILIQIPIFFALYKVILLSVDLRHAPFWGWIQDLSAPDPTSVFNLFGIIPWDPPQVLMIGGWPILFCITMILQKRLSPPMPDPVQERIQAFFPYVFTVMLAHFASGLVIYWTWSNVLSILQQYYILRKVGGEDTSLIRGHAARRKPKKSKGELV